jgi:multidrug efflux pump subunit AcrB
MVPLSALLNVKASFGPERAMRYNGFLSADINGGPAPDTRRARRKTPSSASPPKRCRPASATNGPS